MSDILKFKNNDQLTVGIELELQLINLQNYNLAMEANDFLRRLNETHHIGVVKPEITESMIEINSSVHLTYDSLIQEISDIKNTLVNEALRANIGICGGGTHPFQKWKEQKIFQQERFIAVSEQYGYLAKQFTVFGQHIHIGCSNGDDALYLCHALASYIPHFIALSASSPFSQGVNTSFDCSRLAAISAFPLSGTPPWLQEWNEFELYFEKLKNLGIVSSMKDFYWDIRPKPEYGTIEIRICDTPLTIQTAVDLAFYARNLVTYLLKVRPKISRNLYLTYLVNRFRAARFGFFADIINPITGSKHSLADDILLTCHKIEDYVNPIENIEVIERIRQTVLNKKNDSLWLREKHEKLDHLPDLVREQVEVWKQ